MPSDAIPMTVPLMRIVDIGVFLLSLGVFWVIYRQRLMRARYQSAKGRWMIFSGLGLLLTVMTLELVIKLNASAVPYLQNPVFLPENVPGAVFWLISRGAYLCLLFGAWFALLEKRRSEDRIGEMQEEMVSAAQKSYMQLEERFRNLLDSTAGAVFCWELPVPAAVDVDPAALKVLLLETRLADCNKVFADNIGAESMTAAMKTRLKDLDVATSAEALDSLVTAFADSDFMLRDFELSYVSDDGRPHIIGLNLTGIIEDDLLIRVWGSQTNLRQVREAEAALENRRDYQELVADISSYMIITPIEHSERTIEHCLERVARFIGADRASLFWLNEEDTTVVHMFRYGPGGDVNASNIHDYQMPSFSEEIKRGRPVVLDDVLELEDQYEIERRLLTSWGIRSIAGLPLTLGEHLIGTISFSMSSQRREWTEQEINDLRVVSELFANVVNRLHAHNELGKALDDLKDAKEKLEAENVYLREEIQLSSGFEEIVGQSQSILRALRMVEMVAETDTPVLIQGETGTGKELIARAIHQRSLRKDKPLVRVNCATLPANLIESELFGYEKGAFTGADQRKLGRFDLADGSTLFLDEFGELPLELQTKLLRVLQEGEFERLGGTETISVDVRLVVATNQDLAARVETGAFRSDLYYRVNTFPINMPPLRERKGDVELLAYHFLDLHSRKMGRDLKGISASMMRQLSAYSWPGNVRELEGVIQRSLIASERDVLELPEPLVEVPDVTGMPVMGSTIADLKLMERDHIVQALEESAWRISGPNGAATRLGMPPSTLRSKMKRLEISKPV